MKESFYFRQVFLFKAMKYSNEPTYKDEIIIFVGFGENNGYNLKISKSGNMRPDYNPSVAGTVYEYKNFNYGIVISQLFESKMDSRFISVLAHMGEDDRSIK